MSVFDTAVNNLAELIKQKGHLLIDIRGHESWSKGIVEGATLMQVEDLQAKADLLRKSNAQIYLMCHKGIKSSELVAELGRPFISVSGGFEAWKNAQLIIKPPETLEEVDRYDRQLKLSGFGSQGQSKLKGAHVLVVGAGGLGGPAATYLVAAGVGHVTLVDDDEVALHNLHRQVLFKESEVGESKVTAAKHNLQALNSTTLVDAVNLRLSSNNAETLISGVDLVIDGTDNIDTRFIINDTCLQLSTPWVFAAVSAFHVQVGVFSGDQTLPCFRCLFQELSAATLGDCNDEGILGPIPGVAAMIQVTEAIKLLTHMGSPLSQKMLSYDLLHQQFKVLKYPANSKRCSQHTGQS
ncbi:ThiF family adenylyltransferase [Marinicella sp. S1101]|uniref:ThiF family adenylyltransferase n=1 Tax=Marinicella marina TaxID=2996016 RepID=UPI002260B5CD|nr:ThiF family adenylyltransferase [Marinicella marina]MCX7553618.1 ThiF family adenylyltransferase [Marinicella marina]MDJ1140242.1 ThiF family adenylyltransferase [Marinicella marina]